jgi:hypothetical protein
MATEREVTLPQLAAFLQGLRISRPIRWLVDHHTWSPTVAQYRGISTVRGIRLYHMNVRGWSDNGYHITLGPDGRIFLCRPISRSGGHCIARNADSIGVSLIGNYDKGHDQFWGTPGHRTLVSVLALLCRRFNIDPGTRIGPHARWDPKTCPGTGITSQWGRLIQEVYAAMATEIAVKKIKIFQSTGVAIPCNATLEGGKTRADLRPLVEALGGQLDLSQWADGIIVIRRD